MNDFKSKENMPLGALASPPRRKSVLMQSTLTPILIENNDEAERLALHHEMNATSTPANNLNVNNKRRSLGLGFLAQMSAPEITKHISDCIKLNTENKINTKNAFNLEMIDFMTYMISKKDANMTNLQVASTSLDVSTKIYGFRVDSIHTEIMKMSGGLDRHEDGGQVNNTQVEINSEQENEADNPHKLGKKKKKRNKQKIFGTVDNLRGTIETMEPSLWMKENHDVQTTSALYQVMLPNHANSQFYFHPYNDVVVDIVEHKMNNECIKESIPEIEDFSELQICPPLASFEFLNWSSNNEVEENDDVQSEENNENKFQFNLDASLPSEDEVIHTDINYLDIQVEEETVDNCADAQKVETKIIDLCKVVSNCGVAKTSEYSFLHRNMNIHWAGPSHWKINNFRNLVERSKIVEKCHEQPARRKREIELKYDDKTKELIETMFVLSHSNIKPEGTRTEWLEERITLPVDTHYDIKCTTKLYLHKLIDLNLEKSDEVNATHISDIGDYDYNNENDTSNYCPFVPNNDYETCEDNGNENVCDFETGTQPEIQALTENNLVAAPKLINKIPIAFSVQAKRIDMRQLKKSIWKSLSMKTDNSTVQEKNTENAVEEEENKMSESKEFSKIYKTLPNMLTKTNTEALSFPISFVSLLHLANEKTLKIRSLPDMSEIIVETD